MVSNRIHWIDLWRGLAVLLMIVFHFAYGFDFFEIREISLNSGLWFFIGNFVRFSFLLIVGFSLFLSYRKYRSKYSFFLKHHLTRAIKLMGIALMITLVTFLIFPDVYIRFGILHLISVGIIVGIFFVRLPLLSLVSGFLALLAPAIANVQSGALYLYLFGFSQPGFAALDHFPIFPWIGFILIGIGFAHLLNFFQFFKSSGKIPFPSIQVLGRHSLLIYLIHQPLIFGGIWLLF